MSSDNNYASKIEPRNGGNIAFNNPVLANVVVDLINEGGLTGSNMNFGNDCLLKGEGWIKKTRPLE